MSELVKIHVRLRWTNRWIRCQAPYIGRSCPCSDTTSRTAAIWRRRISRGRRFSAPCEYVSGITLRIISCLRLAPAVPAIVCSTLRYVHERHDGRACPCDRMSHARLCARQRLHTFTRNGMPCKATLKYSQGPKGRGVSNACSQC